MKVYDELLEQYQMPQPMKLPWVLFNGGLEKFDMETPGRPHRCPRPVTPVRAVLHQTGCMCRAACTVLHGRFGTAPPQPSCTRGCPLGLPFPC